MTSKRFELGWWVVKRRAPFHPFINLAWRVVLAIVLESALVPSAGFRVSRKRTSMGNRSLGAFYRVRRCGKSAKPGRLRQHSARPPCNLPSPLRLLGRVRSTGTAYPRPLGTGAFWSPTGWNGRLARSFRRPAERSRAASLLWGVCGKATRVLRLAHAQGVQPASRQLQQAGRPFHPGRTSRRAEG